MPEKKLHPSVAEFREFVKKHPQLIKEVRHGNTNWQELYEEWYLLGEDDPKWNDYHSNSTGHSANNTSNSTGDSTTNQAFINNLLNTVKKMDMNQVQHYLGQLNDAIGTAQQLLTQFNSNQNNSASEQTERRPNLFSFRKD